MYRVLVQPWQPPGAPPTRTSSGHLCTTRAITIAAPPEQVWPWLVQLGYGRAGWYSYDWIDNDNRPSADRILPDHGQLIS